MSHFYICKEFGIETSKKDKKYSLDGLTYNGDIVISEWEHVAFFLVIVNDFIKKELEKDMIYKIKELEISRVQKLKRQYMRIQIGMRGPVVYLNSIEVKFFPAVCNRVIARCDILARINEYEPGPDEHWIGNDEERI